MAEQTQTTQDMTTADEVVKSHCPGCGTEMERTIPAGTLLFLVPMLRGVQLVCEACSARDDAEAAERERVAVRRDRERSCDLPRSLRGLDWDSYEDHRKGAKGALRAAQAWAKREHEKPGIYLTGPVGVGKTRLAATAAWAALDRFAVRYVNVAELIVSMGAGFGDKSRQEALRVLTGRGGLVLDDLDKVNPSMFVLSNLYTAIDGRVQANAPLVVTTNLTPRELEAKLGRAKAGEDAEERQVTAAAIVSRLRGHCTIHGIQGEDGRRA